MGKGCVLGFDEKIQGTVPLGRPAHRWEANIKMDLQDMMGGDVNWIQLVQEREKWQAVLNTVMNLWVP